MKVYIETDEPIGGKHLAIRHGNDESVLVAPGAKQPFDIDGTVTLSMAVSDAPTTDEELAAAQRAADLVAQGGAAGSAGLQAGAAVIDTPVVVEEGKLYEVAGEQFVGAIPGENMPAALMSTSQLPADELATLVAANPDGPIKLVTKDDSGAFYAAPVDGQ